MYLHLIVGNKFHGVCLSNDFLKLSIIHNYIHVNLEMDFLFYPQITKAMCISVRTSS